MSACPNVRLTAFFVFWNTLALSWCECLAQLCVAWTLTHEKNHGGKFGCRFFLYICLGLDIDELFITKRKCDLLLVRSLIRADVFLVYQRLVGLYNYYLRKLIAKEVVSFFLSLFLFFYLSLISFFFPPTIYTKIEKAPAVRFSSVLKFKQIIQWNRCVHVSVCHSFLKN